MIEDDIAILKEENKKLLNLVKLVGGALKEQDEIWGLYGNESQEALKEFKAFLETENL